MICFGRGAGGYQGFTQSKCELEGRIALRHGKPLTPSVLHDIRRSFVMHVSENNFAPPHVVARSSITSLARSVAWLVFKASISLTAARRSKAGGTHRGAGCREQDRTESKPTKSLAIAHGSA